MPTHRSRNKMERKAHMNIHDVIDVADDQAKKNNSLSRYTKDRFGKKHEVTEVSTINGHTG